ncbi:DUF397 domain-containing protein [Streptomyces sp. NPDC004393]
MIRNTSAGGAVDLAWFKSSYSSSSEGDSCVEIASSRDTVHVRDSKSPAGPSLAFSPASWAAFVPYAGCSRQSTAGPGRGPRARRRPRVRT